MIKIQSVTYFFTLGTQIAIRGVSKVAEKILGMDVKLKYGEGKKTIWIPEEADVDIIRPVSVPAQESIEEA